MSRIEAEAWAANSRYKDDTYHVTQGVANARSIAATGFDLSKQKFGRMWGDGVYVGADQDTADIYRRWSGRGARVLPIKLNVKNLAVYEPDFAGFNNSDILAGVLKVPKRDAQKIWSKALDEGRSLDTILSEAGFDGLHIKALPARVGEQAGGNQLIVFDPKNVVVVND